MNIGTLADRFGDFFKVKPALRELSLLRKRDATGKVPEELKDMHPTGLNFDDPKAWSVDTAKENVKTALFNQMPFLEIADILALENFDALDGVLLVNSQNIEKLSSIFYNLVTEDSPTDIKTLRDEVLAYLGEKNYKAVLRSLRSLASCFGVDLVDILRNPEKPIEIIAQ